MRQSSLKDWKAEMKIELPKESENLLGSLSGADVFWVHQGGKSRTWGCGALSCVTQMNREESPQDHRLIPPELQHLSHS